MSTDVEPPKHPKIQGVCRKLYEIAQSLAVIASGDRFSAPRTFHVKAKSVKQEPVRLHLGAS